jgi:hypothetical protein
MTRNTNDEKLNNSDKKMMLFTTYKDNTMRIFKTKKLKRNGLLERKTIKKVGSMNVGRWKKEEHHKFLTACLKYGPDWKKVLSTLSI